MLRSTMPDSTQPSETILFDRNAVISQPKSTQPAASQPMESLDQPVNQIPIDTSIDDSLNNSINDQEIVPVVDSDVVESSDVVGFNQSAGEVIFLRQPVSLLIVKLIGISLAYYFVLWLLHSVLVALLGVFPELAPGYPVNNFLGSPMLLWGSILFIFIVIGIILRWWTIFFQISSSEVVAHSGIIIKQAKVLKRIGISVRQIEIKRNLLGMLLNYVTIEIGSEVMGGVSMTISDRTATLQLLTDALKPGEVLQTKKLF